MVRKHPGGDAAGKGAQKKVSKFLQTKQQEQGYDRQDRERERLGNEGIPAQDKTRTMAFKDAMSVVQMPVTERDPSLIPVVAPTARTTPFPQAKSRFSKEAQGDAGKEGVPGKSGARKPGVSFADIGPEKDVVGLPSRVEIHQENVARLGAMSVVERKALQVRLYCEGQWKQTPRRLASITRVFVGVWGCGGVGVGACVLKCGEVGGSETEMKGMREEKGEKSPDTRVPSRRK